ncbi:uncharacterized protein LOC133374835 isoform X2 [Rhineura floridana]|uniref:uncharacterized protein LOC133374835 isoform X2 n=1 Tax=Rhineura floridana TaxID=261503 RepID=UPI002AC827D2|nr:uncharacterized protein LOC133374835 isoform X2 [Rhineura floridana]
MATSGTFILFRGFMLIAFNPISGNSVRYQGEFKQMDTLNIESMKARQAQPDIIIIQKESEVPLGSYIPQAIQESNEVVSKILSDLQPRKAIPWKQLTWKKKKHWAPNKANGNPFKKRRARFVKDLEISTKARSVDRRDWIPRKFKRQVCMIRNIHNSEDKIQKSIEQKGIPRCVRTAYFDDKEPKSRTILKHSKDRKRRKADGEKSNSERIITHNVKKGQMLGLKERRRKGSTYTGKPRFVSSKPFNSYGSSYSLSSYFTPSSSQGTLSRRLKRSLSSFHQKEDSLEDTFMFNTEEQKIRERRKMGAFPKKREAREVSSIKTVHLKLNALKSQKKLAAMVDRLSDPSNHMSKKEKLSYMHELLDELKLFIKLLQQQILLQSLTDIGYSTTISATQN